MNAPQKTIMNANLFSRLFDGLDDPTRLAIETIDGQRVSYGEVISRAGQMANVLMSRGVKPGDRVALLSENRPEWSTADMAILLLKAVTVPLYTTLTPEQTAFALADSQCRAIFLSSDQHLHKVISILPHTQIEKIITMDSIEFTGDLASSVQNCVTMRQITEQGPNTLGAELETRARSTAPDDLATG